MVYGAAAVLLAAAITTALGIRLAESEARRQSQAQMLRTAAALAAAVERVDPAQSPDLVAAFHRAAGGDDGYEIQVVDDRGWVVAATDSRDVGKPIAEAVDHPEQRLEQALAGELPAAFDEMPHGGRLVLDVSLPLHGDPADPERITGAVHVAMPYRALESLERKLLMGFGISALMLALLLIVPFWFYLERRLLRPMRTLIEANRAAAQGRPEGRMIPADAMPAHELGDAMRTRNEMLARLDETDAELRRRLRELSVLNSTAALLSESMAFEELLNRTLGKVLEITGMEAGEVSLLEPDGKRLVVRAHRGFSPDWLADEMDRPTTCLCGEAILKDEPVCVHDVRQDPRATRLACARDGFLSFCAVPLRAEGQALGVMSLHSRQVRRPSPGERDLLTAIGSQMAVALMNVHLYAETRRLAITDALTGLANRRAFDARLAEEVRRAHRYDRPLALIMADIDHFKRYNDTHGHPQGDVLLRELAGVLMSAVRETDFVARYGGEEFAVILPETDATGAVFVAEKIRATVAAHPFPGCESQPGGHLTISLGVATFPEYLHEPVDLVQRADQALYRAKHEGRNRVWPA